MLTRATFRDAILPGIIGLIDPFLLVSTEVLPTLRQRENLLMSKAAVIVPQILMFVHLNALCFNDAGKKNPEEWLHFRLCSIAISVLITVAALALRRSTLLLRVTLLTFGVLTVGIFAYGMTLGYPFRSQWMSYFGAPIFALALRSPLFAAGTLAASIFLYLPIWSKYFQIRMVMTEYEYMCLFIFLGYLWRRLWITTVVTTVSLAKAEARSTENLLELNNHIRTFVPPVLVRRIEACHRSGMSIVDALDSVLRLRRVQVAILYTDIRGYSRRSGDMKFIAEVVIPSASKMTDLMEANDGIAKIIADGVFSFYSNSDPEESLLRAVRDACICACREFRAVEAGGGDFERHFTVTFGEAFMGNIGSKAHKDTRGYF